MKITVKHYDNEYSAEFSDESSVHESLEIACRLLSADYDQKMVEDAIKVKAIELGEDIGIEFVNDDVDMVSPWDFVEKYYPNYSSSCIIALANDLDMIVSERRTEWSESIVKLFQGDIIHGDTQKAINLHNNYLVTVYQEAIKGYIQNLKDAK